MNPKHPLVFGASLLAACLSVPAMSAESIDLRGNSAAELLVQQHTLENPPRQAPLAAPVPARGGKAAPGVSHQRRQQLYRGVPVLGFEAIEHRRAQGGRRFSGQLLQGIEADVADVNPQFSAEQALQAAQSLATPDPLAREALVYEHSESRLVIFFDARQTARLAYYLSFFYSDAEGRPQQPVYVLDANNLAVIDTWQGLNQEKIGTGPGGNANIGQYQYGSDFDFLDVSVDGDTCRLDNAAATTVDMGNGTSSVTTPFSFDCPRNTSREVNGAYSPLNDAHFFAAVITDQYQQWYGIAPLSFKILARVHYAIDYANAFWNGASVTFGDGGASWHPLVVLDVFAHEVAHGFTGQHSGLRYSGESGGINEAFSDMAGEAAEYFLNGDNDWQVGADFKKNGSGALRYFDDPGRDGVSVAHLDDYREGLDVHYSSGIFNKAFYTLANLPGWTTQKAFDVMLYANQNYWGYNSGFFDAACDARAAAGDLGYPVADVDQAFAQVGLNDKRLILLSPGKNFEVVRNQVSRVQVKFNTCTAPANDLVINARLDDGKVYRLYDDGAHNDGLARDGVYGTHWTPTQTGAIELQITAVDSNNGEVVESFSGEVLDEPFYTLSYSTYDWVDASAGDCVSPGYLSTRFVDLAFPLTFYQREYTRLAFTSFGMLQLDGNINTLPSNLKIPTDDFLSSFIAVYWDDLVPNASSKTCVLYQGEAPNRRVTFAWLNFDHSTVRQSPVSFQATLYENSGNIKMQYQNIFFNIYFGGGSSATVGVESHNDKFGTQHVYNEIQLGNQAARTFRLYGERDCGHHGMLLRGSHNDWSQTPMVCNENTRSWEAKNVAFAAGDQFKFDVYGDWAMNFGDNNGDGYVDQNGSNIPVVSGGEYSVSFDDRSGAYQLSKQSTNNASINFTCTNGYTQYGEGIYVVGNTEQLGNWSIGSNAQKLDPSNYPVWTKQLDSFESNSTIEWKCVKAVESTWQIIDWQSGGNNQVSTGSGKLVEASASMY